MARTFLGREWLDRLTSSYSEERYWQIVMETVGSSPGKRSLEVGSAPGDYSVALHSRLLCEPFGIEYTTEGARQNRAVFSAAGISPANVIEGDFFDHALAEKYRGQFDIVMSRGFIEHFTDPRPSSPGTLRY